MARRRKNAMDATSLLPKGTLQTYNAGLYGRLSVLDNGKVDGDSLESQIELMERFVADRPFLRYVKLYQDNGFTGTNFKRPGWEALLLDVEAGKINCIIVKDLSRLGRNYIETGEFLEKECPRLGIRFISINDGYDSAALNSTEALTAALKNIINDYYAKDISRKACSALATKRKQGDYIGSYAPYGYKKDPTNKNHLIVDAVTAPTIRQIYEWRAAGAGYGAITSRLNEAGIPSPGRYRYEQGIITNNNKKGSRLLWNRHILSDILKNPVYIGHLVQGKCRSSLYKGVAAHRVPEDEWDVALHTHEPLLPEELFNTVQRINGANAARYKANYNKCADLPKETNPYRERLVCADCGAQLKLYRSIAKNHQRAYYSYLCPVFEEHRELSCRKKSIRSFAMDEAVLTALKLQMDIFLDRAAALESLLEKCMNTHQQDTKANQRKILEKQIDRKSGLSAALYIDWKNGILTRDEFIFAKEQYVKEIDSLKQQLHELEAVFSSPLEQLTRADEWKQKISHYYHAETVTQELVNSFITLIRLDERGQIDIMFSFEKDCEKIEQELERLRKEVA